MHSSEPEKPCIVIPEPAIMKSINNRAIIHPPFAAKKRLEENNADTIIEKSTVIVKFLENNKIEEHHQIIFRAENLPSGNIYSSKNFIIRKGNIWKILRVFVRNWKILMILLIIIYANRVFLN